MWQSVIMLDGPIGVGKTSIGKAVASELGLGFIDGDDHSAPGPWINSILTTCREIVLASEAELLNFPGVIVAYPMRCTTWVFFEQTFRRRGIACHCIGLVADVAAISARARQFRPQELARSKEMIVQGYGQRPFSDMLIRTDEADLNATSRRLVEKLRKFLSDC